MLVYQRVYRLANHLHSTQVVYWTPSVTLMLGVQQAAQEVGSRYPRHPTWGSLSLSLFVRLWLCTCMHGLKYMFIWFYITVHSMYIFVLSIFWFIHSLVDLFICTYKFIHDYTGASLIIGPMTNVVIGPGLIWVDVMHGQCCLISHCNTQAG